MVLRDSVGRSAGTGALLRRLARSVRASARYFSAAERRVVAAKGRIRRRFRRTETRPRIKVCGCRCGWRTSTRSTGSASGGDRSDASADGHAVERAGDACAASGWPRVSRGQGTWGVALFRGYNSGQLCDWLQVYCLGPMKLRRRWAQVRWVRCTGRGILVCNGRWRSRSCRSYRRILSVNSGSSAKP